MEFNQRHFEIQNLNYSGPSDLGTGVKYYQYSSWVLQPHWTQSINLQLYNQKTCSRINWNGYLLFSKNFDCDLWRSFDGRCQPRRTVWCPPVLGSQHSYLYLELSLTFNSNKSWEIQLLFKNFKVVLKHFQSLYMNGSNFSSSQRKVGVRQVC